MSLAHIHCRFTKRAMSDSMALLSIPKLTGGDVFEGTDWFDYLVLAAMLVGGAYGVLRALRMWKK